MTYLITYDLLKPGQDYADLVKELRTAGAVRILQSTWLVRSNVGAEKIRDLLLQLVDTNDRVFVCSVDDWAYWRILNPKAAQRLLPK